MYIAETIHILTNLLNGKSIRDELEEGIKKRGEGYRSLAAPLFKPSIMLEDYVKKHIKYDFEENGTETAEFLFMEWNSADSAPIRAMYFYNLLAAKNFENKQLAVLIAIDTDLFNEKYLHEKAPLIDEAAFFALIDKHLKTPEEKYSAVKLYYNFDRYHAYAMKLLTQAEGLIKTKLPEFDKAVKTNMDDFANKMDENATDLFKEEFRLSLDMAVKYEIYPGLYRVNSITISTVSADTAHIYMGYNYLAINEVIRILDKGKGNVTAFLKCLSDGTKLTILQLLKEQPLYGSQLAEKLNCTGANITHHMNVLSNLDVVYIKKDSVKAYFHLNTKKIVQYLDDAKDLFS